ncbi:anthranilate synthase component 1 [Glaciecola petra]|uniref:Anthranilate synthase component 1 n=1 Tax=Glaciecola petra TaxID=3075602 RepID=A0ABU2ZPR8_9ALTE|nr:anthranilate synthase component 1 [Aestuariibacter sp. P117]MDT0594595.1 anthranilate synthase component 1 [Aestuariibacter sp. P117]
MNLSDLGKQAGRVETITVDAPYIADPLNAYAAIAGHNSILLESAEINSKDNLKSLLLVDAALRIQCDSNVVTVEGLSANGQAVLPFLQAHLSDMLTPHADESGSSVHTLTFTFPLPDPNLDEDARLKQDSVFDVLRILKTKIKALRNHPHAVFVGGVFAYDLLATFERLPSVKDAKNTCPDYVFYLSETLILVDHQHQSTQILGSVFSGENVAESYFAVHQRLEFLKQKLSAACDTKSISTENLLLPNDNITVTESKDDAAYCEDVNKLKENILDGDIFQVVPSRTFSIDCPKPLLAYLQLKLTNPSPYMFYMNDKQFVIFGASPESALKYDASSNLVEVYPIAGTRPRGKREDGSIDVDLDSRLELDLQQDEKEKAEHIMLVDLARNDVARVCEAGSRFVKDLLKVDRYSHVMHLVSRVVGSLRSDLDALHAYQACMNMGTLVGAPKISAASLIRETELERRGSYGGAVGYFNGQGDFDTCIVIRSAFVKDGIAHVQAGAGVVNDSVAQSEADETRAKAQAVISAIKRSHSDPVSTGVNTHE